MAQVACTLCSVEQHHAQAEHVGWKCERCGEIVRGCVECCKQGMMVVRGRLAGKHGAVCPGSGQECPRTGQ